MSEQSAGRRSAADVCCGLGSLPNETAAPVCVWYRDFATTHPMNGISYQQCLSSAVMSSEALAVSDPLRVGSSAKRVHRGMWPRPLIALRSPQPDETSAVRNQCVVTIDARYRSESLLVTMPELAQLVDWYHPDNLHERPALAPCPPAN